MMRMTYGVPVAAALALAATALPAAANKGDKEAILKKDAEATLSQCVATFAACAQATENAAGVLVFPEVTSASFIVGGAGSKGVLYVDDQFAGFYGLGEGSVGLQAGVEKSSQVYALDQTALDAVRNEGTWKIGADAEITVIAEGATEQGVSGTGGTKAFVFDEKGLEAGVSLKGLTVFALNDDLERVESAESAEIDD